MEEKIIIKSKHYDMKRIKGIIFTIPCVLIGLGILFYILNYNSCRVIEYEGYPDVEYTLLDNILAPIEHHPSGVLIDLGLIIGIISIIIGWWLKSYSMTVTDKRIYGRTSWGKQVDLPIDAVSAIATNSFKGIAVATSSGKISFNFVKNGEEIYSAINQLIIDRQAKKSTKDSANLNTSDADEIKKYKELLDNGVITQEEFDAKKKELLGL